MAIQVRIRVILRVAKKVLRQVIVIVTLMMLFYETGEGGECDKKMM